MDDIRRHVESDEWIIAKTKQVLSNMTYSAPIGNLRFHVDNGFLKYKNMIVLSPHNQWRQRIFDEHHRNPVVGHTGFLKTYKRLSKSFYWEGMKKDIKDMVASCAVCQQHKYEALSPARLLQPLPIPSRIWYDISMDFIIGLPPCKGKTMTWVVVDRLSEYAHFVALAYPYTTSSVTNLFVENIFKLHGMPTSIICDRNPVFLSGLWK